MSEKNKANVGMDAEKANSQEQETGSQEDIEQLRAELKAAQAELTRLKSKKKSVVKTDEKGNPRRRVKIRLYRDNNKNRDPLLVSVNDYTALIKRGVTVEVPYFVAKHIEEMAEQDAATVAMIEDLTQQFAPKSGVLS